MRSMRWAAVYEVDEVGERYIMIMSLKYCRQYRPHGFVAPGEQTVVPPPRRLFFCDAIGPCVLLLESVLF
jgi:hypothetical protein